MRARNDFPITRPPTACCIINTAPPTSSREWLVAGFWRRVAEPGFQHGGFHRYHWLNRGRPDRSEEHTSELQSRQYLVCCRLLETKNTGCFSLIFLICRRNTAPRNRPTSSV